MFFFLVLIFFFYEPKSLGTLEAGNINPYAHECAFTLPGNMGARAEGQAGGDGGKKTVNCHCSAGQGG